MTPPQCDGCGFESPEGLNLRLDWEESETVEVRLCASCCRVVARHCGAPDPGEKALAPEPTDD